MTNSGFSIDSLLHLYRNTYYKMPQSVKTFLGSLYGTVPLRFRFGSTFSLHRTILEKYENGTDQFRIDYIYNKLLETIMFAETNIPYYRHLYGEYGISSAQLKSPEDIALFPYISKSEVKNNLGSFYTDKIEKPASYFTGGSLSTPTQFFLPLHTSRAKEKAYNNYVFSKIGYRYRNRTLLLKGRDISRPEENIFWEYEPVDNYFLLSNNYLNSEHFPQMYAEAAKFSPKFLFGYPSAILSFIEQCRMHGLSPLKIDGVILSSESIYPHELNLINNFFHTPILTHYGHTERTVMAYRLNQEHYRFLGSYGVARSIENEIVSTGFDNFVMPLINYKTGDSVAGENLYFPGTDIMISCSMIEGRTKDFLVTDDHRLISITTMCGGQHLPVKDISNLQYVQNKPGEVTVLIEKNQQNVNIGHIQTGMKKLIGDGINFHVEVVDSIEKSKQGKRIICKQNLDIEKIRRESAETVHTVSA